MSNEPKKSYTIRVRHTYQINIEVTALDEKEAKCLAIAETVDTPIEDFELCDWSLDTIDVSPEREVTQ